MELDPWWLILVPVLFGLGWIAARVDVRQMLSETRKLPDSYFRGLNFLLNEQPDRAIDAFIEVVKLDPETIELHFALGSLFRRRGELERAIRVHQNLIQRSDLPEPQRQQALHELAHDYLKAGMLDRAEDGFQRLKGTRYAVDALRSLIRIYETVHDWPKAIAAVQTLQNLVDEPVPQALHYYCEQAAAALGVEPPDIEAAQTALDAAMNVAGDVTRKGQDGQVSAHGAVRLALLRARLAALESDPRTEREALESIVRFWPEFAGMAAPALLDNARAEGRLAEVLGWLRSVYEQHPSHDLFNALLDAVGQAEGPDAAWQFARRALQQRPSLLGLDRLLQTQLERSDRSEARRSDPGGDAGPRGWIADDDAVLVRSVINRPAQRLGRYTCRSCGFRAKRFYWQCPGCNAWETYLPKRLEEIEGS